MNKKVIYKGAEAEICLSEYMGKKVIQKKRIPKTYRIKEIDSYLISYRTREESKLISEALTIAKKKNAASVIAHVLKNNTPALKLVEKLGFLPEKDSYKNSYGDIRKGVGCQFRLMLK